MSLIDGSLNFITLVETKIDQFFPTFQVAHR